ncbi:phosphoribosylanthranilate isomerase [Asticcacaulis solisilvae]|uniref:phosphoribosylanthranilate isomerase n=1 Tax=Asticcacaulis solisilvae TaxID=1217274 RepID=UPI003FD6EFA9
MTQPAAPHTKICGISTLEAARVAARDGAAFLGFIHFAKSPRHLTINEMAALMQAVRDDGIALPLVSVTVNPDETLLTALRDVVKPDMIQLHGHETPERVAEVKALTGLPVIKAISVSNADDLTAAKAYEYSADYLLFDARTPKDADLPGGLGLSFDWTLLAGRTWRKPWFLAGGLDPDNVAEALRISGAEAVDVSSGVESAPGLKSPELISRFLRSVKAL